MATYNFLIENDGEVRTISIDAKPGVEDIEVYISSELDDMINTWDDLINTYGNIYYKSLRGYRKYQKCKFTDLRNS